MSRLARNNSGPVVPVEVSPDWCWSKMPDENGNPRWHVCNDESWFTEYTPVVSRAYKNNRIGQPDAALTVKGIGKVKLSVRRDPGNAQLTTELLLTEVLHIPDLGYNIICHERIEDSLRRTLDATWSQVGNDPNFRDGRVWSLANAGQTVAYFSCTIHAIAGNQLPRAGPKPCCVAMAEPPRGCTLRESTFRQILVSDESWIRWISFDQGEEERLVQIVQAQEAGAARPHTQPAQ